MKSILLAVAGIGTVMAAPAFAQDAETNYYSGPRIEVQGGADWVRGRLRVDDGIDSVSGHATKSGATYGGQIGYDFALRPAISIGAFASYDLSSNKACEGIDVGVKACLKAQRTIEAGARIGTAIDQHTMLYAKGAYVNSRFRASVADNFGDYESAHDNRGGWRLGAGAEFAVTRHAYLKAEYNYSRYASYKVSEDVYDASLRLSRQEALAGFGFRL